MKNLSLFRVLFLALAVFAISSCGDDGDDPSTTLSPTIDFVDGTDLLSAGTHDLNPGETFKVNIVADKGDNDLSSLTIYEDDVVVDFERIVFEHVSTSNNPQSVDNAERIDWTITITAHDDQRDAVYDFEITDDAQNKTSAVLNINTVTVVTTVFTVGHSPSMGCLTADAFINSADLPSSFCLAIDATRGDEVLSTVTIYENNDVVDASRLDWTENPYILIDDEVNAFANLSAQIDAHNAEGTSEYRMVVTDASGATMEAGIFVTVGTAVTSSTGALLLNAGGGTGTGGLDLNTGTGTGSNDAGADIKDEGLDLSQPAATNWKQQISGTNGSEIRSANNLPEGFSFDNIAITAEIAGAFDASDALTSNTTDKIDLFDNPDYNEFVVLNSDGEYFFIKIEQVEVTPNNNADQYTISIKQ